MIEIMPESAGNIVGLHVTGRLREEDYKTLLPRLEAQFRAHGRLRILFYADRDFEGWDLKAAWEDTSFGLAHAADFERLALVGAPDWVVWCVRLSAFLMKGEVCVFDGGALDEAWAWIRG